MKTKQAEKAKFSWHRASEFRAASRLESAAIHKRLGLDILKFKRIKP